MKLLIIILTFTLIYSCGNSTKTKTTLTLESSFSMVLPTSGSMLLFGKNLDSGETFSVGVKDHPNINLDLDQGRWRILAIHYSDLFRGTRHCGSTNILVSEASVSHTINITSICPIDIFGKIDSPLTITSCSLLNKAYQSSGDTGYRCDFPAANIGNSASFRIEVEPRYNHNKVSAWPMLSSVCINNSGVSSVFNTGLNLPVGVNTHNMFEFQIRGYGRPDCQIDPYHDEGEIVFDFPNGIGAPADVKNLLEKKFTSISANINPKLVDYRLFSAATEFDSNALVLADNEFGAGYSPFENILPHFSCNDSGVATDRKMCGEMLTADFPGDFILDERGYFTSSNVNKLVEYNNNLYYLDLNGGIFQLQSDPSSGSYSSDNRLSNSNIIDFNISETGLGYTIEFDGSHTTLRSIMVDLVSGDISYYNSIVYDESVCSYSSNTGVIRDGYAYIFDNTSVNICTINLSSNMTTELFALSVGLVTDGMIINGDNLSILDTNGTVKIFDLASNSSLSSASTYTLGTTNVAAMAINDNYIYLVTGNAIVNLEVFDIINNTQVSTAIIIENTSAMSPKIKIINNNQLIVSNNYLNLIDISNVLIPSILHVDDSMGSLDGVVVVNENIYILETNGIKIFAVKTEEGALEYFRNTLWRTIGSPHGLTYDYNRNKWEYNPHEAKGLLGEAYNMLGSSGIGGVFYREGVQSCNDLTGGRTFSLVRGDETHVISVSDEVIGTLTTTDTGFSNDTTKKIKLYTNDKLEMIFDINCLTTEGRFISYHSDIDPVRVENGAREVIWRINNNLDDYVEGYIYHEESDTSMNHISQNSELIRIQKEASANNKYKMWSVNMNCYSDDGSDCSAIGRFEGSRISASADESGVAVASHAVAISSIHYDDMSVLSQGELDDNSITYLNTKEEFDYTGTSNNFGLVISNAPTATIYSSEATAPVTFSFNEMFVDLNFDFFKHGGSDPIQ